MSRKSSLFAAPTLDELMMALACLILTDSKPEIYDLVSRLTENQTSQS
jgi:hypothetical protein